MPQPRRIERLQQYILEVAATAVQRDLNDPRIGFVTLTRVKLTPDMAEATVYWSILGTDAQRRTSERALTAATPVIQAKVAKSLATRTTPTLKFQYDPSIAQAAHLDGIFAKLREERGEPAVDVNAKVEGADDEEDAEGEDAEATSDEGESDSAKADADADAPPKPPPPDAGSAPTPDGEPKPAGPWKRRKPRA